MGSNCSWAPIEFPMHVTIERFKKLDKVEIPLNGITLLVGGNNAGKSSVLQAIQFGVAAAQTSLLQVGAWSAERLSTSIGQSELVYSPIKDVISLARNGKLREPASEAISITYTEATQAVATDEEQGSATVSSRVTVRKGRNKNVLLEIVGRQIGERLQSIEKPFCTLVTGLAGIPAEEKYLTPFAVQKAAARGDSNSVFRNILWQLRQLPTWSTFHEQFSRVFPGYTLEIAFDPSKDEFIECHVRKGDDQTYPIDTCGTGVLQAIQIFSYIHLFRPEVLLLDEPDSHLHANNQKQLASELLLAAETGTKIVIATHSRHLVEALSDESQLTWLSNGNIREYEAQYEVKAMMEIGALGAGERLLQPDWILLTEDADVDLITVIAEANGADMERGDILSYSGCTKIEAAIILINQLRKTCPSASYIIHRDRDFLGDTELDAYKAQFNGLNVSFLIPERNDLEGYVISSAHISHACGTSGEQAEKAICSAFDARKNALTEKYINTRVSNAYKAKANPNPGALAVECAQSMTDACSSAVHGKTLLKGVRDELRAQGIDEKRLLSVSPYLEREDLKSLFSAR